MESPCHDGAVTAPVSPPPPDASRRRHWVLAVAAGWAVLLMLLAYVSARRDAPTVREQRDLPQAERVAATAAGELVSAVGPGLVLQLDEARTRRCRVTPVRDGASARLRLTVYPPAGAGDALLDRVAAALPAAYRARVYAADREAGRELVADAGEFVGVTGEVSPDDDAVIFEVSTGCRPMPDGHVAVPSLGVAPHPEQLRVLVALGGPRVEFAESFWAVPCPGGRRAQTKVVTLGSPPVPPQTALKGVLATVTAVRGGPDVYAYLADGTSVVVQDVGDGVRVAATSGCT